MLTTSGISGKQILGALGGSVLGMSIGPYVIEPLLKKPSGVTGLIVAMVMFGLPPALAIVGWEYFAPKAENN